MAAVDDACLLEARLELSNSAKELRLNQLQQLGYPDSVYLVLSLPQSSNQLRIPLTHNRAFLSRSFHDRLRSESGENATQLIHSNVNAGYSPTFCYYSASADPSSGVKSGAVNLCRGYISGFLSTDGGDFVIESSTDNDLSSDRVFVIRPDQVNKMTPKCDQKYLQQLISPHQHSYRRKRSTGGLADVPDYYAKHLDGKTRYMELVLVSDTELHTRYLKNVEHVRDHLMAIANIVNQLYMPLNMRVVLTDVDIWTTTDPVVITSDHEQTLNNFLYYRKNRLLNSKPNDNAQLLTGKRFGEGVVGKANKGTMCSYEYSGGVNSDKGRRLAAVASTVAHEIGHNFGMEHDNETCKCDADRCIMSASSGGIGPTIWSDCSVQDYAYGLKHGTDFCLRDKPDSAYSGPICGNGLVESGEECDCGDPKVCTNACCVAATCRLAKGAQCASGECCNTDGCTLKKATTVCRASTNPCDLPEYCDGKVERCPLNTHIQNGLPCNGGKAFCYDGRCGDRNDRCSLLWGKNGRASAAICDELNMKTPGAVGNCGYDRASEKYKQCEKSQIRCGRLHCEHDREKPEFGEMSMAHIGHTGGWVYKGEHLKCYSVRIDFANVALTDPGMTPDGAICDTGKMCVDTYCVPVTAVRAKVPENRHCDPENCNNLGVCNQFGNCHCDVGYGGTDCSLPGQGGSIDSGPAGNVGGFSVWLMLLLFLLACGVAATVAYWVFYRRKRNIWPHEKFLRYFAAPRGGSPDPRPPPSEAGDGTRPTRKAPPPPLPVGIPQRQTAPQPIGINKVWSNDRITSPTVVIAPKNPWSEIPPDASTHISNGYGNSNQTTNNAGYIATTLPRIGFKKLPDGRRPEISPPIPQSQMPAKNTQSTLHLRFKNDENDGFPANNGVVKLRARTLDDDLNLTLPPISTSAYQTKIDAPELPTNSSSLQRQPSIRPEKPPPPRPKRPRDSELQRVYDDYTPQPLISPKYDDDQPSLVTEVMSVLDNQERTLPKLPFKSGLGPPPVLPHKPTNVGGGDTPPPEDPRQAGTPRKTSGGGTLRKPNAAPPPPPPKTGVPPLYDQVTSPIDEEDSYYDVISPPPGLKRPPALPTKPPTLTKPQAQPISAQETDTVPRVAALAARFDPKSGKTKSNLWNK